MIDKSAKHTKRIERMMKRGELKILDGSLVHTGLRCNRNIRQKTTNFQPSEKLEKRKRVQAKKSRRVNR